MTDKEKELIKELKESIFKSLQVNNELAKLYDSYFSNTKTRRVLLNELGKEEFDKLDNMKMKNFNRMAIIYSKLKYAYEEMKKIEVDD